MHAKLSVVLGGGNGIGAATCRLMAERGWQVVVVDLDEAAAASIAKEIEGHSYGADVSDSHGVDLLASRIESERGPVASLVVSSGAFQDRFAPDELPVEVLDRILNVNVKGTYYANRSFGMRMAKRGKGSIVNVASATATISSPLHAYGPSKGAIITMTKTLAGQWGRSGVRVNSVSPGATLVERVLARAGGRYSNDIDSQIALGRRIQPIEVAEGIEFLASDRASAITGTDLLIDAGQIVAGDWGIFGGVPASIAEQP